MTNLVKYVFARNRAEYILKLRPDLAMVTGGRSASTGCAVLHDVYYEPRLMYFVEHFLDRTDIFVDVGANVGIYSLLAARRVSNGRVLAIEANPEVFAHLKRNLTVNSFSNLQAVNYAVTAEPGEFKFLRADGDCEGRLLSRGEPEEGCFVVTGQPLPEILVSLGINKVNCIKLDVEGSELGVLEGARGLLVEQMPVILIDYYQQPLAHWLSKIGFEPYRYSRDDRKLTPVNKEALEEHGSAFVHSSVLRQVENRLARA